MSLYYVDSDDDILPYRYQITSLKVIINGPHAITYPLFILNLMFCCVLQVGQGKGKTVIDLQAMLNEFKNDNFAFDNPEDVFI